MTVANPGSPAERLASVRARLEAALKDPSSIISGALIGLETDVASVCATIPNLPPKEAHALAPEMKHVIGLLELLSKTMAEKAAEQKPASDSANLRRKAAAAYGSRGTRKG
ncbi:hypothetical protein [uncultured Nisaea sp.]|jgi:hypothetical protein|uniref:hypothetical protein n=1 Tax=uncultured Nisaea sp. TaxID=538215 RepID=UPI0030ED0075|tara:strand:+ start:351 stop:683 length:333 start_codon:yes stop_codon:yes gene_type:complete